MTNAFLEGIGTAYTVLEARLKSDREEALEFFQKAPSKRPEFGIDYTHFVKPPKGHGFILPRRHLDGRVPISLGNGYLAKFLPEDQIAAIYFTLIENNVVDNRFEEENVRILREAGFTEEEGFLVPDHKVMHVKLEDGVPKVNEELYGWVIVTDLTEDGQYEVTDVMPHHFVTLDNRQEFLEAYERNLKKLQELYVDPRFDVTVYRHASPKNPSLPLSRMLLARVKDNKGEVAIGDLNNLVFDRG